MCSICTFPRCILAITVIKKKSPNHGSRNCWFDVKSTVPLSFHTCTAAGWVGHHFVSMPALARPGLDLGLSGTVDSLPVWTLTSDLHRGIQRKKNDQIRADDFGVQFSFKGGTVTGERWMWGRGEIYPRSSFFIALDLEICKPWTSDLETHMNALISSGHHEWIN